MGDEEGTVGSNRCGGVIQKGSGGRGDNAKRGKPVALKQPFGLAAK